MKHPMKLTSFLAIILLLLPACAGLPAARALPLLLDEPAFRAAAADYANAPLRQSVLAPPEFTPGLEALAARRSRQRDALIAHHAILVDHARAVAALAGAEPPPISGAHLGPEAPGLLTPSAVDSATRLSELLANLASGGWRSAQMRSIITSAAPDVDRLAAALHAVASTDFTDALDTEEAALRLRFGELLKAADRDPSQAADAALLRERLADRRAELSIRRATAARAATALATFRTAYARLAGSPLSAPTQRTHP